MLESREESAVTKREVEIAVEGCPQAVLPFPNVEASGEAKCLQASDLVLTAEHFRPGFRKLWRQFGTAAVSLYLSEGVDNHSITTFFLQPKASIQLSAI